MELGTSIRTIRKEKGIAKKDLAEKIDISVTALGQIENNTSMPKKTTLLKISDALGVPTSYIIFCALDEKDVSEDKRAMFKSTSNFLKDMLLAGKIA